MTIVEALQKRALDASCVASDSQLMIDDRTPEVTNNQEQPTLRDQFAMAIITGKIYCFRSDTQDEQDDYARRVYALVDSMMKARTK